MPLIVKESQVRNQVKSSGKRTSRERTLRETSPQQSIP